MGRKVIISTTCLNQWSLDFDGNLSRIEKSISLAKLAGAKLRVGAELEITGYSCQDHFLETDTVLHSWEVLAKLLQSKHAQNIIVDTGMPVMHKNVLYNCRVVFLNKKILLIRPKLALCDDDVYRESRFFVPWRKLRTTEEHYLPRMIRAITGQTAVPFGDALLSTLDTCIGFEICEELWRMDSPHSRMSMDGAEIILNGSGSYTELRKAYYLVDLVKDATKKTGCIYVFSNLRGCDGERVYFNGWSCIASCGYIVARSEQFSLKEVETVTATLDLEDVRSYKVRKKSCQQLSTLSEAYPRVHVEFTLGEKFDFHLPTLEPLDYQLHTAAEEIARGPACYLWDYLRRSGQGGFFLPLSGGRDSAAVACIVYSMCTLVCQHAATDDQVLKDVRRLAGDQNYIPTSPKELCSRLLFTCYMGTQNSSADTNRYATDLAHEVGSSHQSIIIDTAVSAVLKIFEVATGIAPRFTVHGGGRRENLALQNVQARLRMVFSYFFAQLVLWSKDRAGGLLVLGTANVDESLRGYMTKYDCSSADINPIGSISKMDLDMFMGYCVHEFGLTTLGPILAAPPTAELEPLKDGHYTQTDEVDMGMTYEELSIFGRLRRPAGCGPYSMFGKLIHKWPHLEPEEVAKKVKHFFRYYAINRHKMTVLTPAYHCEAYSPDDHRNDHRPFLYNVHWPWQFRQIDLKVKELHALPRQSPPKNDSPSSSNTISNQNNPSLLRNSSPNNDVSSSAGGSKPGKTFENLALDKSNVKSCTNEERIIKQSTTTRNGISQQHTTSSRSYRERFVTEPSNNNHRGIVDLGIFYGNEEALV